MLFNLIIGIIAGYATHFLEAPLGSTLRGRYAMDAKNLRVLTFIAMMLAAAILMAMGGINGRPFILLIGGGIGIFFDYLWTIAKHEYQQRWGQRVEHEQTSAPKPQTKRPRKPKAD